MAKVWHVSLFPDPRRHLRAAPRPDSGPLGQDGNGSALGQRDDDAPVTIRFGRHESMRRQAMCRALNDRPKCGPAVPLAVGLHPL